MRLESLIASATPPRSGRIPRLGGRRIRPLRGGVALAFRENSNRNEKKFIDDFFPRSYSVPLRKEVQRHGKEGYS
jgi:hypothetical protein